MNLDLLNKSLVLFDPSPFPSLPLLSASIIAIDGFTLELFESPVHLIKTLNGVLASISCPEGHDRVLVFKMWDLEQAGKAITTVLFQIKPFSP